MKRSVMLQTILENSLHAIQMCRDIIEGNFNAMMNGSARFDAVELQARIYTDLEILASYQPPLSVPPSGDMLIDVDPGDEDQGPLKAWQEGSYENAEPASADR